MCYILICIIVKIIFLFPFFVLVPYFISTNFRTGPPDITGFELISFAVLFDPTVLKPRLCFKMFVESCFVVD